MKTLNNDQILRELIAGNKRFAAAKLEHPNQTIERRIQLVSGQEPFAVVLGCADSRVPPELVFDRGLGDLFVIRVAGNIVSDGILGDIEFAVDHLGVSLVLVLGHLRCAAVSAAIAGHKSPDYLRRMVTAIQPAVEKARDQAGDLVGNAARANVALVVDQIKLSMPTMAQRVKENTLTVVGAHYDLDSGLVEFL